DSVVFHTFDNLEPQVVKTADLVRGSQISIRVIALGIRNTRRNVLFCQSNTCFVKLSDVRICEGSATFPVLPATEANCTGRKHDLPWSAVVGSVDPTLDHEPSVSGHKNC